MRQPTGGVGERCFLFLEPNRNQPAIRRCMCFVRTREGTGGSLYLAFRRGINQNRASCWIAGRRAVGLYHQKFFAVKTYRRSGCHFSAPPFLHGYFNEIRSAVCPRAALPLGSRFNTPRFSGAPVLVCQRGGRGGGDDDAGAGSVLLMRPSWTGGVSQCSPQYYPFPTLLVSTSTTVVSAICFSRLVFGAKTCIKTHDEGIFWGNGGHSEAASRRKRG